MKFVLTAIKPRKPIVELKFSDYNEYQKQKKQYYRDCYSVAGYVETNNEGEIDYEDKHAGRGHEDISVQY